MSNEIKVLGDVSLHGTMVFAQQVTDFPANPQVGTLVLKDQALYAYIRIGGLETWYPFASKTNSYIHSQALPAITWTVNHSLGTADVWYQVKDATGQIVSVGKTIVNENTFTLNFTSAITGTCVVVAPTTIDVPQVKAASILVGGGGEVVINSGGVFVNGQEVLTDANIAAEIAAAVAPKADTTYVDAQLATKAALSHNHAGTYDLVGSGTAAVVQHMGATDPHPQYLDQARGDARYYPQAAVDAALVAKADLVGGKVPASQIPNIALTEYLGQVASQATMLALDGQKGDWCIRSDTSTTWIMTGNDPAVLANWTQISTPTDAVSIVNGQTGAVTLTAADVGADAAGTAASLDVAVRSAMANMTWAGLP